MRELKKNKISRALTIFDLLKEYYPPVTTFLTHKNEFELLIAVILSAQCTDERVNKVTPLLFKRANNPFDMSKLAEKVIYNIIRPCGLAPKKSYAIKNLSKILMQ